MSLYYHGRECQTKNAGMMSRKRSPLVGRAPGKINLNFLDLDDTSQIDLFPNKNNVDIFFQLCQIYPKDFGKLKIPLQGGDVGLKISRKHSDFGKFFISLQGIA
jgi:hypothetical protein